MGKSCRRLSFGLAAAAAAGEVAAGGRREEKIDAGKQMEAEGGCWRKNTLERRAGRGSEETGLLLLAAAKREERDPSWWGTGREMAEGVQRVKSSQLPFSIRFCFASSEFRHLHNTLSFKNNVGVPDIELCEQVCSQLSEELLLPPPTRYERLAQMCWPLEESHEHIFQKVSPSQNPIEWLFLINQWR